MLALGAGLFAFSLLVLWLCLPSGGQKQWFLRGGLDTIASIVIVVTFVVGAAVLTIRLTEGSSGRLSLAGTHRTGPAAPSPQ